MRQVFNGRRGQRMYVITTFGTVIEGEFVRLINDIVEMLAPDNQTTTYVNLIDVSGVRYYDERDER